MLYYNNIAHTIHRIHVYIEREGRENETDYNTTENRFVEDLFTISGFQV